MHFDFFWLVCQYLDIISDIFSKDSRAIIEPLFKIQDIIDESDRSEGMLLWSRVRAQDVPLINAKLEEKTTAHLNTNAPMFEGFEEIAKEGFMKHNYWNVVSAFLEEVSTDCKQQETRYVFKPRYAITDIEDKTKRLKMESLCVMVSSCDALKLEEELDEMTTAYMTKNKNHFDGVEDTVRKNSKL